MIIKGIQHCGLVVQSLEKSCWFYGNVLALPEIPRPRNFTFSGAWFRCGLTEIHLIAAGDTSAPSGYYDPGPGKKSGLAMHFSFEVTDLAAMQARLENHGLEILGGPLARGDGADQFYLQDPDGYLIEFFQWTNTIQRDAAERSPVST